jgi:hypothetical protein
MVERQRNREVVAELEAALDEEDSAEKNYHVREALQLLELDEDETLDEAGS